MARVTVEDCLDHDANRFALCLLAARRARQLHSGVPSLVRSNNREAVTALREIAAGRVRYAREPGELLDRFSRSQSALHDAQDEDRGRRLVPGDDPR